MYISQSGSGTAQGGCGGCTQLAAPPGVPLYLCVRDACDIAVEEILKRSMRTAGVESPSVPLSSLSFCAQKNIIKLLSNVLVLENT